MKPNNLFIFLFLCFAYSLQGLNAQSGNLVYTGQDAFNMSNAAHLTTHPRLVSDVQSMAFNTDGTKLFILSPGSIYEYSLSTPYGISSATFSAFRPLRDGARWPAVAMQFSTDGRFLFVAINEPGQSLGRRIWRYQVNRPFDVTAISNRNIRSTRPSLRMRTLNDIRLSPDGLKLFVLGFDFDTQAQRLEAFDLRAPYDLSGTTPTSTVEFTGTTNYRSMDFNVTGTELYLVNDDLDVVHTYELSAPYVLPNRNLNLRRTSSDFSVSGQTELTNNLLFNTSGRYFYTIDSQTDEINEYIVRPDDYREEETLNNGSIFDDGSPMIINLNDRVFQDTDNDNMLDVGTEINLTNIPAGLIPVITLSNGDTSATLNFTGMALSHTDSDDVASIGVSFTDLAFVGGNAADVQNSGSTIPYDSGVGIDFIEIDADPTHPKTTIDAVSPIAADGITTSEVTVQLAASDGTPLTTSGGTVILTVSGSAVISTVTDNNDGTYTATVTNTEPETVIVNGQLEGQQITDSAEIIFSKDTDGDSVADILDLDDDNDGILDVEECEAAPNALTPEGQIGSFDIFSENFTIAGQSSFGNNTDPDFNDAVIAFFTDTNTALFNIGQHQSGSVLDINFLNTYAVTGNSEMLLGVFGVNGGAFGSIDIALKLSNGTVTTPITYNDTRIQDTGNPLTVSAFFTTRPNGDVSRGGSFTATGGQDFIEVNFTEFAIPNGVSVTGLLFNNFTASFPDINGVFLTQNAQIVGGNPMYCSDSDDDGIPNNLDLDSDNDGIYDVIEAGGIDTDNDGRHDDDDDNVDNTATNGVPSEANSGNGIANPTETTSGTFDFLNLDSDRDGCSDANEAYQNNSADGGDTGVFGTDPADFSTIVDPTTGLVNTANYTTGSVSDVTVVGPDLDNDGIANICDNDVDGDGVDNDNEDINNDGDPTNDDTDNDGTPNYLDPDDDGDGIPTADEDPDNNGDPTNDDTDNDGTPNYLDPDDDGDGIPTSDEDINNDGDPMNDDTDNDGTPDYLDPIDNTPNTNSILIDATGPVLADGVSTSTITVTLADANGNLLDQSGGTVTLNTTGNAVVNNVTDNNDGTYTATVTNTVAETVTITGALDGNLITDDADIEFIRMGADPLNMNTTITATGPVLADGVSTSIVTVTLADANGNLLDQSGGTVTLTSTGSAVISNVTDNNDGIYTATVTNLFAETVVITGALNSNPMGDYADIEFVRMGADPLNMNTTITATGPVLADGVSTSTVTVTLADANGNLLDQSGGTVTLTSTGSAVISNVTDNNDGTYTATVTNTVAETVTITGALDGNLINDDANILFTQNVIVSANDDIIVYNGISPNGDGRNDFLTISNLGDSTNSLEIYNRWGVKVYETEAYGSSNNFFQGISQARMTVNSEEGLPMGTYYYVLKYQFPNENQEVKMGYIFIRR